MKPDRSLVDEKVRSSALSKSDLNKRAIAWARCDGHRRRYKNNPTLQRLVAMVSGLLPGFEVVSEPGDRRIDGNVIVIELPVLKYNVDIAIPAFGIVIENDEQSCHTSVGDRARDKARDKALKNSGWGIVRLHHLDWVFDPDPKTRLSDLIVENCRRGAVGIPGVLAPHPCACGCGEMVRARKKYVFGHVLTKELASKAGKASAADGSDPNADIPLCRSCAADHHEYWDDMWNQYHRDII